MNENFIIYKFLIFIYYIHLSHLIRNKINDDFLILKLYKINYNNISSNFEETNILYSMLTNNIYINLNIGTPEKQISGFISGKDIEFMITNKNCYFQNSYYNKNSSSSYKKLSEINVFYTSEIKGYFSRDKFIFNSDNINYKFTKNKLKFVYSEEHTKKNKNFCGLLGLQINSKDIIRETPKNFITYLLEINNNKENIYWTIIYNKKFYPEDLLLDKKIKGLFYIGIPSKLFINFDYNENNFIKVNSDSGYSTDKWGLNFEEILLVNNNNKITLTKYNYYHFCLIYPEYRMFIGTSEFMKIIKQKYFANYFKSGICNEEYRYINEYYLSIHNYGGYYLFYICNLESVKKIGINNFFNSFPDLIFYHEFMNYSFVFKPKELFKIKNNFLYFQITRSIQNVDQWILGKIFMKKYQLFFNNDMNVIGFYTKELHIIEKNKKIFKKGHFLIIILLAIFLFIMSSLVFFKLKIKIKKIKYAKELELKLDN